MKELCEKKKQKLARTLLALFLVPMLLYVFFQKFGGIWNFLIGKPLGNFSLYYPSSPPLYLSLYYHEVEIPMNEETAAEAEEIIGELPYMRKVFWKRNLTLLQQVPLKEEDEDAISIRPYRMYFYPEYFRHSSSYYIGNGYEKVYQKLLDFCYRQMEEQGIEFPKPEGMP